MSEQLQYGCDEHGYQGFTPCPTCYPESSLAEPQCSATRPLNKMELAKLNAALVLIRRGDIHLATRSLAENPDAGLALDLQAYIARHSPNTVIEPQKVGTIEY